MTAAPAPSAARVDFAMRVSLWAGFGMLAAKVGAYVLTGSAGILGDAAESVVHIAVVIFAAFSVRLASKPADENHRYGHSKIAFFSTGVEGGLIVIAAAYIVYQSINRWIAGLPPANIDKGAILTGITVVVNGLLGVWLLSTGRRHASLILRSHGRHVLTDCWTSVGALAGLALVHFTGWPVWDPLCGLAMAANIVVSGYGMLQRSVGGLMDVADPGLTRQFNEAFERETQRHNISFHALRHRDASEVQWVDVHLLFPDTISLRQAHRIATEIEAAVSAAVAKKVVITSHLECAGDHGLLHPDEETPPS